MSYRLERVLPQPVVRDLQTWLAQTALDPAPSGSSMTEVRWPLPNDLQGHARLVLLLPSQQIVEHVDPPIAGARYHVPLQSDAHCWVLHAGTWQQLTVGWVYSMDPSKPHGAVNWGPSPRVHLMVDVDA